MVVPSYLSKGEAAPRPCQILKLNLGKNDTLPRCDTASSGIVLAEKKNRLEFLAEDAERSLEFDSGLHIA